MKSIGWNIAVGCATLLVMTALVLLITVVLLDPPTGDLVAMSTFLILSGGVTILLGLGAARLGLPRWVRSIRARLLLTCLLTAVLALVNVGFTSYLMFLSTHDLALLTGLLSFSLGMSIYVAFTVSRSTSQSLQELLQAVRDMSTKNLSSRVPKRSNDEAGELSAAFNAMAERLESSLKREKELERARKGLIVWVSHDLRTPLASIRAMVEGINDGVVREPETVQRYLKSIQIETENLSQLINDLFELSQIDAGVLELHTEGSPISDLISDTLESMSAQAAAHGLRLTGAVDGEVSPVVMDAQRVQRVLYNLIQNSIRHTPADGTICIRAKDAGTEVQVEVSDTGEGIPEEELRHLFEGLHRSARPRSKDSVGAGLGLNIAKGIVEAHGGRIWVESSVGIGSTFAFALPKTAEYAVVNAQKSMAEGLDQRT